MVARARMSIIAALLAGCSSGGYVVELELDPASLAASVDRIELAVVRSCPAVAQRVDDPVGVVGEVRRLAPTDARRRLDLAVAPGRIGLHARAWQGCDLVAAGCEEHDVAAGGSGTLGVTLFEQPRSADCPGVEACCGAQCVSLADDERHCGACGAACAGGETCSAGACGAPGDAGLDAGAPDAGPSDAGRPTCDTPDDPGCCPPDFALVDDSSGRRCLSGQQMPEADAPSARASCLALGGCPNTPADGACGCFWDGWDHMGCYSATAYCGGTSDFCLAGADGCADPTMCPEFFSEPDCTRSFFCSAPPAHPIAGACTRDQDCARFQTCASGVCTGVPGAERPCCHDDGCAVGEGCYSPGEWWLGYCRPL